MRDPFSLDVNQRIESNGGVWYRNVQTLGHGGNAITFLAVAVNGPNRGVPFAIKLFQNLSRPERRDSFLAETKFLRECNHPSIMRVFDAGSFRCRPFLVAEYLPATFGRQRDESVVVKLSFALQLLSALVYLENLDPPVVHRDIKPDNIFVKGRSCVLGDFGLLKRLESIDQDDFSFYKQSLGVGMPFRYRTPDLVAYLRAEAALSPKSDVFQLGLVLAELFTGQNPLRQCDAFTDRVELDPLSPIPGAFSGPVSNLIHGMLELDPSSREPASRFLELWDGIFEAAVKQAHTLEGKAIW